MYYVLCCEGPIPITPIDIAPRLPGGPWFRGTPITIEVPKPLEYILSSSYRGTPKAFYAPGVPLIRMDLVEALYDAGVNNFELFDAILKDPVTGQEYHNYKAFNLLGNIDAADMEKSQRAPINFLGVDLIFESIVLDPSKTQESLMFRLAQNVSAIMVHEKVKLAIENRGILGMVFYKPEDWSG